MNFKFDGDKPIFQQLKDQIEDAIIDGYLLAEERIPSINEFAKEYQINPATANKGVNELVDQGIIYKKRGVGMYVSPNAKQILLNERKIKFETSYVEPLVSEAERLGISRQELIEMLRRK